MVESLQVKVDLYPRSQSTIRLQISVIFLLTTILFRSNVTIEACSFLIRLVMKNYVTLFKLTRVFQIYVQFHGSKIKSHVLVLSLSLRLLSLLSLSSRNANVKVRNHIGVWILIQVVYTNEHSRIGGKPLHHTSPCTVWRQVKKRRYKTDWLSIIMYGKTKYGSDTAYTPQPLSPLSVPLSPLL